MSDIERLEVWWSDGTKDVYQRGAGSEMTIRFIMPTLAEVRNGGQVRVLNLSNAFVWNYWLESSPR